MTYGIPDFQEIGFDPLDSGYYGNNNNKVSKKNKNQNSNFTFYLLSIVFFLIFSLFAIIILYSISKVIQ